MAKKLKETVVNRTEKIVNKSPEKIENVIFPHSAQIGLEDTRFRSNLTVKGSLAVTGSIVSPDQVQFDSDVLITDTDSAQGRSPTLTLRTSDTGTNDAALIQFEKFKAISANVNLGEVWFYGGQSAQGAGGALIAEGDGTWVDGTSHPTRMLFYVNGNGTSVSEALRITSGSVLTHKWAFADYDGSASNFASLVHRDISSKVTTEYAMLQQSNGRTLINSAADQNITFRTGNGTGTQATFDDGVLTSPTVTAQLFRQTRDGNPLLLQTRQQAVVDSGEVIGGLQGRVSEDGGSNVRTLVSIEAKANQNYVNGSQHGSRIEFFTTPDGGGNAQLAATIENNKDFEIVGDLEVLGNRITFGNGEYIHNEEDGSIRVNGHLRPDTDNTYDLGHANVAWRNLNLEGNILFTNASTISVGASEGMTISSAGIVRKPSHPTFRVAKQTAQTLDSDAYRKITGFTNFSWNRGSHFNSSTNVFTAPVSGLYMFGALVDFDKAPDKGNRVIAAFTRTRSGQSNLNYKFAIKDTNEYQSDQEHFSVTGSMMINLDANNTVYLSVQFQETDPNDEDNKMEVGTDTRFWGTLIA